MLRRMLPLTLALLLPAFLLAPVHAAPASTVAAASISKITSVEGITEYRLGNGLKVLLFPDATQDTITLSVTYLVGSRHEGYGEYGMGHLLEHLQFKGTPRPPPLTSKTCRSSACRPSTANTTSPTTPCCWSAAGSTKPLRSASSRATSATCPGRRARSSPPTPPSRPRTGSAQ